MTTAVHVEANLGPVRVTHLFKGREGANFDRVVPAGNRETFNVHDHLDLVIHEIQPDERAPHEERVIAEEKDVSEKLSKLSAFLHGKVFATLLIEDQKLLEEQYVYMLAYAAVLRRRIARFQP
jgi:hypothetical protein